MKEKFPIIKAGCIFNPYRNKNKVLSILGFEEIEINYPCRLDAMAINPSAVSYNSNMIFTPGEVVVSIKKFINVKIKVMSDTGGIIKISSSTKRKSLVKHSYKLMCDALNVSPSLEIAVDSSDIPKHCGFGSSSSIISAVAVAINELYNCPISNDELIKYLASNHGEEISDDDEDNLKVVQCIGGGATNGMTEEGIIIIAGQSTRIAKMYYEGEVLVCLPADFVQKDAKTLMELEEKNLWRFKKTGDLYSEKIAYELLHKALPDMANGNINELSKVVFTYRFDMGSNDNCSFVYDGLNELSNKLRILYENNDCEFLALSSVGPAFFAIVKNSQQKANCIKKMKKLKMTIIETEICNNKYEVVQKEKFNNFWELEKTSEAFTNRPPSKYITDVIDGLNVKKQNCIDIGCGGGRYSKYLIEKGANVLSVDKYKEMVGNANKKKINFIQATMDNIPVNDNSYDLALSIGVIHNSTSVKEYKEAIREIYRILSLEGVCILSVFTNDLITNDLIKVKDNMYNILNRPPMILLSKEKVNSIINEIGFSKIEFIDEHITDVGNGGKRNVYTVLLKK